VLALDDVARVGALRFRLNSESPFLAAATGKLPPLVRLSALLRATDAIHSETETAQNLRFLLGAGSALGGARPKSAVSLADEQLAIAKFPKPDDTRDIGAGEILALTLAGQAGIRVAEHHLVSVGGHSVAVIARFDRAGQHRIPFISAATLLGLSRGDPGAYTMLADGIRQFGSDVSGDLRELWRRLIFSLLASNYDDHLRNHGFLMREPGRWSLSPAYDMVSSKLLIAQENDCALTVNGKRNKVRLKDFAALADNLDMPGKPRATILERLSATLTIAERDVPDSHLPPGDQEDMLAIIGERWGRIYG